MDFAGNKQSGEGDQLAEETDVANDSMFLYIMWINDHLLHAREYQSVYLLNKKTIYTRSSTGLGMVNLRLGFFALAFSQEWIQDKALDILHF